MENMNYGETEVLEENYTPDMNTQDANTQYANVQVASPQYFAPAYQHPTNRGVAKMIFLSILTFGIYGIVVWCKLVTELNVVASRYDGKRTCPYFAASMLTSITFGIYSFVWQHKMANRIGAELRRRGYGYKVGASDFWLWGILGSLIIVGPFVYCHKILKGMNLINASYNMYG